MALPRACVCVCIPSMCTSPCAHRVSAPLAAPFAGIQEVAVTQPGLPFPGEQTALSSGRADLRKEDDMAVDLL